jgi:hypothetical protein
MKYLPDFELLLSAECSLNRISSQSIDFSSGECSLDRSNVDQSKYDSIDRLFKALSKLQQLQKQIQEKQERNLEHRIEAKQ